MWTAGVAILAGGMQGIVLSGNQATGAVNGGNVLTPNRERALTGVQSTGFVGTQSEEGSVDPYINNVSILLHGDGANLSTTITDNSNFGLVPSSVTGNVGIRTANFQYGTGSLFSDGTGDSIIYSSADNAGFNLETGDFTIEFYARAISAAERVILTFYANSVSGAPTLGWVVRYNGSTTGVLSFTAYSGAVEAVILNSTTALTGSFQHIAISRISGMLYIFVNGALEGSTAWAGSHNFDSTYRLRIFGETNSPSATFNGNIDELRITKGVGRYNTTFTPRSSAFPNSPNPFVALTGTFGTGQAGSFAGDPPYAGAITVGAAQELFTPPDNITYRRIKAITSTTALLVYYNSATNDTIARVLTTSGDTVTAGTALTVVPGSLLSEEIQIGVLSPTLAILVYRESFDNYLRAITISISGTSLSANTAVDVHAQSRSIAPGGLAVLSPTSVLLVYTYYPGGDPQTKAKTLTISGTTITAGNEFSLAAAGTEYPLAVKLTTTTALAIYQDATSGQIYAKVLTAGTTMTGGSEVSFGLTGYHYLDNIIEQSSTAAIVIFDEDATGDAYYAVISVSGTVPTINTPVLTTDIPYNVKVVKLSDTQFFGNYSLDAVARVYTRTGNSVVPAAAEVTILAVGEENGVYCLMSYGKVLVNYVDYTFSAESVDARVLTLT